MALVSADRCRPGGVGPRLVLDDPAAGDERGGTAELRGEHSLRVQHQRVLAVRGSVATRRPLRCACRDRRSRAAAAAVDAPAALGRDRPRFSKPILTTLPGSAGPCVDRCAGSCRQDDRRERPSISTTRADCGSDDGPFSPTSTAPTSAAGAVCPAQFLHSRGMTGAATGGPIGTPRGRTSALERLLAIDEVAQILGISERGVFRLLSRGELVAVKVGTRTRIEPDEIRTYIANRRRVAAPKEALQ
jgi:excisionase family DNA binding protein